MIVVGEEFTWWPRDNVPPAAAEVHEVYATREDADHALSSHIATNMDLGMDKSAYVLLSRVVGPWEPNE